MRTLVVSRGRRSVCVERSRLWEDRSGNVAITFALTLGALMLALGASIDLGRWLHARDATISAIDAALLAGGRALQVDNTNTAAALAVAQKFYGENVASRLPVQNDTVAFTVTDNGKSMTASGTAYIDTLFLRLANIDQLPLLSTGTVEAAKAELAVGGKGGQSLEISIMLDVTGSMAGQKLLDLKASAEDLIGIVVWDDQSKYTSKVALVPFSEDIRLPTATARDTARGTGLPSSKTLGWGWYSRTYYLSDCVVERTGSQKSTDAEPKSGQYVMAHYTQSSTGSGSSRKGVCTVPVGSEVMPLTSDKTALIARVESLSAAGGTGGHLGTAWAWYTLSPNWSSLWAADSQPQAYGTQALQKIAILMTDGEYNTQYDSNGVAVGPSGAANGSSTAQARALCTAMKAAGITVYTVGFELGSQYSESYQTLSQCATDPTKFYNASDGDKLKQAFRDIALKLSTLYLSK